MNLGPRGWTEMILTTEPESQHWYVFQKYGPTSASFSLFIIFKTHSIDKTVIGLRTRIVRMEGMRADH